MKKKEGNLIWEVTEACNPVTISVYDAKTGLLLEEQKYTCQFEPRFGFDCYDVSHINRILDLMIDKYKYGGKVI